MKKRDIILIVLIAVGAAGYGFLKGFLKARYEPDGSPQQLQSELSAMKIGLPKTIDKDLQLWATSVDDHLVSFHYKVLTRSSAEVESEPFVAQVRGRLVSGSCSDRDLQKRFLSKGTTVRHVFQGNDMVPIASIDVKPEDCPKS